MGQGTSKEGRALCEAVKKDDSEAVRRIASSSPEAVLHKTFWKRKTPLMLASQNGNVLIVSTCLWASEQVLGSRYLSYINDASSSGSTALVLACKYGHPTIVRVLLEEGASPLLANRRGETAAHVAAHRGHVSCLEMVLDAPVRALGGGSPVAAMALIRDHAGETRFIDAHDRGGFTALHLAAIYHSSTATAALVQRGATLDVPVLRGMERLPFLCGGSTPLHIAAAQGDCSTCRVLLDGQWRHPGLELRRVRNMLGLTPLNCALLGGHHEVVRILVDSDRGRARGGRRSRATLPPHSLPSMVPLHASFPDALRDHMLAVLQRAALLVQLRQIAGGWQEAGEEQPSDAAVNAMPGLESLSLKQIEKLQRLLRREDASLRDVLYGLESTLRRRRHGHRASGTDAGTVTAAAGAGSGTTDSDAEEEEEDEAEEGEAPTAPTASVPSPAPSSPHLSLDWSLMGRATLEGHLFSPTLAPSGRSGRRDRERERAQRRRGPNSDTNHHVSEGVVRQYSALERTLLQISEGAPPQDAPGAPESTDEQTTTEISPAERGNVHLTTSMTTAAVAAASTATVVALTPEPAAPSTPPLDQSEDKPSSGFASVLVKTSPRVSKNEIATSKDTPAVQFEDCSICMDSVSEVAFQPCSHSLCFQCACRLCARGSDATTCPFCRREVEAVIALAGARKRGKGVAGTGTAAIEKSSRV